VHLTPHLATINAASVSTHLLREAIARLRYGPAGCRFAWKVHPGGDPSKTGSKDALCTQASVPDLSMAIKASHVVLCCAVFWLCSSLRLQAWSFWSVWTAARFPLCSTTSRRVLGIKSAWQSTEPQSTAATPLRHLLAVFSAPAEPTSGAACKPAFPLVEATISGVHAAFLGGTLTCSQLIAVRTTLMAVARHARVLG